MAKWYTKVTTHSWPFSVILVKSQLLVNVTIPWVGNWTMDWSNWPLVQQQLLHWVIVCLWKNGRRTCECSAPCPRQLSLGLPYFHHCWEKLNKSTIGAITHQFPPTSRKRCPMLALTTFESYLLMGLPTVPVTSRPYSSSKPMAIISKPRFEQSWLTKHLAGCASFTPTPTTTTCCPYWHVLRVTRTCTYCGSL